MSIPALSGVVDLWGRCAGTASGPSWGSRSTRPSAPPLQLHLHLPQEA